MSYNENGFYIAKNLLPIYKVTEIKNLLHKPFKYQLDILGIKLNNPSIYTLMKTLFDADINKYKKATSVLSRLFSIYQLLTENIIVNELKNIGMTELVVPTGPVVHIMSENLKIPGGYYGQGAHQDWTSMQGSLDAIIVWIPLVSIDRDLYPLEIIPGSHKKGLCKGEVQDFYYKINDSDYDVNEFQPVELNVGDVLFMSCWTIHRSGLTGRKNDVRLGCSIRYENLKEPTYITRGYPTAYKRIVNRELFDDNFPGIKDVNKIFNVK